MNNVIIFGLVLLIVKFNECFPHNSTVVPKYAKVAVWGNNNKTETSISGSRNSKSGNIWNHRLDPKSISTTTKNRNPSVVYQYPVYQRSDSDNNKITENVPGIGEVIVAQAQDRFEARPLFAYRNKVSVTYGPPVASKSSASSATLPVASPPAPPVTDSSDVAAPPSVALPAPSGNLYNSPYSSYNPPSFMQDDSNGADLYPPNGPPFNDDSGTLDSVAQAPPNEGKMSASTEPVVKENTHESHASLGPPLVDYGNNQGDEDNYHPDYDSHIDQGSPQDPMAIYKHHDKPPQHPPKSIDDVYYPPDFPKDQIHGHNHGMMMNENGDDSLINNPHGMMTPENPGIMSPEDGMVNDEKENDGVAAQDDNMDLAPPPPSHGDYDHGHAFPPYLYDHHHYDHHVYEEIPHTTMAPEKEDKRVSSTNYSYYYLGRKLWYIPLYFSIYFIIYVTVLILKSIARHKVRLKYKWYEHDTSAKHARSMNLDDIRHEEVSNLHQNVSVALKNTTAKYNSVIAM